jgi:hypothetical protein
MYLQTYGSFKSTKSQKIGSANRKSAKYHICGRSTNLTNYSPQISDMCFKELVLGLGLVCQEPREGKKGYMGKYR